jgi:hypothetical protein
MKNVSKRKNLVTEHALIFYTILFAQENKINVSCLVTLVMGTASHQKLPF